MYFSQVTNNGYSVIVEVFDTSISDANGFYTTNESYDDPEITIPIETINVPSGKRITIGNLLWTSNGNIYKVESINDEGEVTLTLFFSLSNSAPVTSVNGKTGAVIISKSDIGLGNVDNTSDFNKPISTSVATALLGKLDRVWTTSVSSTSISLPTDELVINRSGDVFRFTVARLFAADTRLNIPAAQVVYGNATGDGVTSSSSLLFVNGNLRINVSSGAHAKAILQINSTDKGILPPRMTTAQRDAMNLNLSDEAITFYNLTSRKWQVKTGTGTQFANMQNNIISTEFSTAGTSYNWNTQFALCEPYDPMLSSSGYWYGNLASYYTNFTGLDARMGEGAFVSFKTQYQGASVLWMDSQRNIYMKGVASNLNTWVRFWNEQHFTQSNIDQWNNGTLVLTETARLNLTPQLGRKVYQSDKARGEYSHNNSYWVFVGESREFKTITASSYSLLIEDIGYELLVNTAADITVSIPSGVFNAGHTIKITQIGTGKVTLSAPGGIELIVPASNTPTTKERGSWMVVKFTNQTRALVQGQLA